MRSCCCAAAPACRHVMHALQRLQQSARFCAHRHDGKPPLTDSYVILQGRRCSLSELNVVLAEKLFTFMYLNAGRGGYRLFCECR